MEYIEKIQEQFINLVDGLITLLPEILFATIVIFLTLYAARIIGSILGNILKRMRIKMALVEFLQKVTSSLVWVAGVLIAITILFPTVTPGKIITALGLSSIAIGFAFKDIFENFMAGVIILFREPFKISDIIEVEGTTGKVVRINIRDTVIRGLDGRKFVVPNAVLFKNTVTVLTARDKRRVDVLCGIGYDEDIEAAKKVIKTVLGKIESVSKDHPIDIQVSELGASSIDLKIFWYTGSEPGDSRASVDEVLSGVKKALDRAGIEIPYPHQVSIIKDSDGPSDEDVAAGS